MTLIYESDLKILKKYLGTKMNFLDQGSFQNLEHYAQTEGQTDRQTDTDMQPKKNRTHYHGSFAAG